MRPTALTLNILVAGVATVKFYRAGLFKWNLFWPFAKDVRQFQVGCSAESIALIKSRIALDFLVDIPNNNVSGELTHFLGRSR